MLEVTDLVTAGKWMKEYQPVLPELPVNAEKGTMTEGAGESGGVPPPGKHR